MLKRISQNLAVVTVAGLITACGGLAPVDDEQDSAPQKVDFAKLERVTNAVPKREPRSRYGNPRSYKERGNTYYVLDSSKGYVKRGTASWYGTKFHGRRTSSGESYDMFAMTAAHKTLPLPTYASVTNLKNGKQIIVKINDRGPFVGDRIIDLSYAAAYKLDIIKTGTGFVEVRALDPSIPTQLNDNQVIAAAPLQAGDDIALNAVPITAPPAAPAPTTGPNMFLQVAAFSSRQNAELLRKRLSNSAFQKVSITQAAGNRFNVYRVRLGPLANESIAQRLAERLFSLGLGRGRIVLD